MTRSFVIAACLGLCACARAEAPKPPPPPVVAPQPVPRKPTDVSAKDYEMPALPRARVTLADAFGGKHVVEAEVAASRDARTRGLMWRTELPEGKGMLFIFPRQEQLSFWMRNTLIPLDMVFITSDRTVLGIVENAAPQTLVSRLVKGDSQYVLELPGGASARLGLKPGLAVQFEGLADVQVTD